MRLCVAQVHCFSYKFLIPVPLAAQKEYGRSMEITDQATGKTEYRGICCAITQRTRFIKARV